VIPKEPWRPHYWRDRGIVLAGALLLALGAMWLVELFNRPARARRCGTQPVLAGTLLRAEPSGTGHSALNPRLAVDDRPRLAAPLALPRELTADEVAALLHEPMRMRAAQRRCCCAAVTEETLVVLADADAAAGMLHVGGAQPRQVPLAPAALLLLAERPANDTTRLLRDSQAGHCGEALASKLLVAAHDAGIEQAHELTAQALRHTYSHSWSAKARASLTSRASSAHSTQPSYPRTANWRRPAPG